jgi:hypothetical protein
VGLTSERDGAGTAVTTFDVEVGLVDEVRHRSRIRGGLEPPR